MVRTALIILIVLAAVGHADATRSKATEYAEQLEALHTVEEKHALEANDTLEAKETAEAERDEALNERDQALGERDRALEDVKALKKTIDELGGKVDTTSCCCPGKMACGGTTGCYKTC